MTRPPHDEEIARQLKRVSKAASAANAAFRRDYPNAPLASRAQLTHFSGVVTWAGYDHIPEARDLRETFSSYGKDVMKEFEILVALVPLSLRPVGINVDLENFISEQGPSSTASMSYNFGGILLGGDRCSFSERDDFAADRVNQWIDLGYHLDEMRGQKKESDWILIRASEGYGPRGPDSAAIRLRAAGQQEVLMKISAMNIGPAALCEALTRGRYFKHEGLPEKLVILEEGDHSLDMILAPLHDPGIPAPV